MILDWGRQNLFLQRGGILCSAGTHAIPLHHQQCDAALWSPPGQPGHRHAMPIPCQWPTPAEKQTLGPVDVPVHRRWSQPPVGDFSVKAA